MHDIKPICCPTARIAINALADACPDAPQACPGVCKMQGDCDMPVAPSGLFIVSADSVLAWQLACAACHDRKYRTAVMVHSLQHMGWYPHSSASWYGLIFSLADKLPYHLNKLCF
jgi:hypothetical protein